MRVFVDGHNLIAKLPNIHLDEADDEEKLLVILRRYRAKTGHQVTVFFDAGYSFQVSNRSSSGGITAYYARHGVSADTLIINRLYKDNDPHHLLVVTSDRAIQQVAKQVRANVISSTDFAASLANAHNPTPQSDDPAVMDDIALSEDEVNAWLDIFGFDNAPPSDQAE